MPRSYRHIQECEKEIIELKHNGYTGREICEKFGFSKKQYENFITRYNRKQDKIAAGIALRRKGRPPKDYVVRIIDKYIHFYNNERIQLKTKLTPQEMRCQYIA